AISAIIDEDLNHDLHDVVKTIGDIERIIARIALRSARPRDFARLRNALTQLPELQNLLGLSSQSYITELAKQSLPMPELQQLLSTAIVDNPPVLIRDGGVLAPGYNSELDVLRDLSQGASNFLAELEQRERDKTGISSLKVGYNKVHGFFIEMSRTAAVDAPVEYIRRQTLKNNERFITEELKSHEEKVLSAQSKYLALEKRLYDQLFDLLAPSIEALQVCSDAIATIDVLNCLAERALSLNYQKPQLTKTPGIHITAGRHPVVEQVTDSAFIANPVELSDKRKMLIITGPNMGGKSTYMRQVALITLLAHIGSFVPVESAQIGVVDRIFTRIGASDDLASGRSTFMVEMTETANILHNATASSLVLLDEIGRGTSTYDGLSLAWACAEYLATKTNAFTLFATHYFELTALAEQMPSLANVHLDAIEHDDTIVFMHAVQEGAASKSFGLQVAQLAGVPKSVINRAKQRLAELEQQQSPTIVNTAPSSEQIDLFNVEHPIIEQLKSLDENDLTAKQALDLLFKLKQQL
ncbi:MAG: DNA mismatch repair protein MutS, partial [Thalassotalea sp.]|nr:DNA mismatch repair protein MutS [Thalassotalea sp.]